MSEPDSAVHHAANETTSVTARTLSISGKRRGDEDIGPKVRRGTAISIGPVHSSVLSDGPEVLRGGQYKTRVEFLTIDPNDESNAETVQNGLKPSVANYCEQAPKTHPVQRKKAPQLYARALSNVYELASVVKEFLRPSRRTPIAVHRARKPGR